MTLAMLPAADGAAPTSRVVSGVLELQSVQTLLARRGFSPGGHSEPYSMRSSGRTPTASEVDPSQRS
jgi:hypothetical protein